MRPSNIECIKKEGRSLYIAKRYFTARNILNNEMKNALNEDVLTSQYMPSEKYAVVDSLDSQKRKFSISFRTKKSAREWIENL